MNTLNGILLMNKQKEFTSFDVIGKLRGILKTKKMGHAGTLDPMATGVLPVFIGKATKAICYLEDHAKRYTATFRLGTVTDTQDITGTILATKDVLASYNDVKDTILNFLGNISQIPPMYSAVKVNGKRLYDMARKGIEIEREPRHVSIEFINITNYDEKLGTYTIDVGCSKGTYIRTLCHDIGQKLGCGAVLTELIRTEACGYSIDNCVGFDDVQKSVANDDFSIIKPVETAFDYLEKLYLNSHHKTQLLNGIKLSLNDLSYTKLDTNKDILYAVYNESNLFLGLCETNIAGGVLTPKRIFAERV